MQRVVDKVAAYVTRGRSQLVFKHRDFPEAGRQVPAGTLKPGEDPQDGVLSELTEESGLSDVRLVSFLGNHDYGPRPETGEVHRRHVYHIKPNGPAPQSWLHYETSGGRVAPIAFVFSWVSIDDPTPDLAAGQGALLCRLGPQSSVCEQE